MRDEYFDDLCRPNLGETNSRKLDRKATRIGKEAIRDNAAALLGLADSEVNGFCKRAPSLLGISYVRNREPSSYKKGGRVTEIEISLGVPRMSKHDRHEMRESREMKRGAYAHGGRKKPEKRAFGGILGQNIPASAVEGANRMLERFNMPKAMSRGGEMKRGGTPRKSMGGEIGGEYRKGGKCYATGGKVGLTNMSASEVSRTGRGSVGFKNGGRMHAKMAAGGVGKIRKHQSNDIGKPMPSSYAMRFLRDE